MKRLRMLKFKYALIDDGIWIDWFSLWSVWSIWFFNFSLNERKYNCVESPTERRKGRHKPNEFVFCSSYWQWGEVFFWIIELGPLLNYTMQNKYEKNYLSHMAHCMTAGCMWPRCVTQALAPTLGCIAFRAWPNKCLLSYFKAFWHSYLYMTVFIFVKVVIMF